MPSMAADELAHDLGRSGLPKLRLSVIASGRPPTAVMLRQASATACLPPSNGIGLAIARRHVGGEGERPSGRPSTRTTPASPPGSCTVLPRIRWSYCSHTQRLRARGPASRRASAAPRRRHRRPATLSGAMTGCARVGDVRPVVDRRLVAELLDRQVGHDLALVLDDEAQVSVVLPMTAKSRPHLTKIASASLLLAGLEHHEHALLALRQHHLVGASCPSSRHGTLSRSSSMPRSPLAPISTAEQVRPAAPMSWMAMTAPVCHQLEAGFQQQLFGEGVADLHGRALLLDVVVEFGRRHGGAVDAVAAGLGAEIDDRDCRRRWPPQ